MTDAEQMRELLRYANFAKVGKALGVSRAAVAQWAKGQDVSPTRLQEVVALILPTHEEAAPSVTERLEEIEGLVRAIGLRNGMTQEQMDDAVEMHRALAVARRSQKRPVEDPPQAGQRPPGTSGSRGP